MSTSRFWRICAIVTLLPVVGRAGGSEQTIVHSFSRPLSTTPWIECFAVPTLDPSQGTLERIDIAFTQHFSSEYRLENLGSSPEAATVAIAISATLEAPYFGGEVIGSASPAIFLDETLAAFDGTLDFSGPSGVTSPQLQSANSGALIISPGDPRFADHVGFGYLDFCASANGALSVTSGPVAAQSDVRSGLALSITYTYRLIDCNSNGIADATDIGAGTSLDCDGNAFPDECQHDHDLDGLPDSCDPQCLVPGPDSDGDGVLDLCDTAIDCDSNHIPDAFEIDRNQNGIKDTCEFSGDCNLNGLPDALDLAVGISDDFDQNDVPDECQSSSLGYFQDCTCQPLTSCEAVPNATGQRAEVDVVGSCRIGDNQFALQASHLPPNRPALFFQGALAAPTAVGLGFRCIASPMSRLGIVTTDAQGNARFDVDFAHLVGIGAIRAWDSRAFQVAFRDAGPAGPSIQFSGTVHLRFCP